MKRMLACVTVLAAACSSSGLEADNRPETVDPDPASAALPGRPPSAWCAASRVLTLLDDERVTVRQLRSRSGPGSARVEFDAEFRGPDAVASTQLMVDTIARFEALPGYMSYGMGSSRELGHGVILVRDAVVTLNPPSGAGGRPPVGDGADPALRIRGFAAQGVGPVAISTHSYRSGDDVQQVVYAVSSQDPVSPAAARAFLDALERDGNATVTEVELQRKDEDWELALDLTPTPIVPE